MRHGIVCILLLMSLMPRAGRGAPVDGPFLGDAPQRVQIPQVDQAPRLRDVLGGDPTASFAKVTGFLQRDPGDGTPASLQTDAYLAYDTENLYVAFVCQADPDQIRARLAPREQITEDDRVAVYLDPFLDRRQAYIFQSSAAGIQRDGFVTEGAGRDYSFDAVWEVQAEQTARGYAVLMTIPFRALRFPPRETQRWGVALSRIMPRRSEQVTWPHITRRREGFVTQFAMLTGLEHLPTGLNALVIPYSTYARGQFRKAPNVYDHERVWRLGFDVKATLRDAFALDLALNPDFSQIAPEAPQVTVNRRFEVTFPERRPFFTENAAVFETSLPLFYSRRIVQPQLGARVVGKTRAWTIGGLLTDDRPSGEAEAERFYNVVVRAQRRWADVTTGGLFTTRYRPGRTNVVGALDGRYKIGPRWVAEGQAVLTGRRTPDAGWRTGSALYAGLEREGRHVSYEGEYQDVASTFRAELGRIRRSRRGTRQTGHELSYQWRPRGLVTSFGPEGDVFFNWRRDGRLLERSAEGAIDVDLVRDTEVQVERAWTFERYGGVAFRRHQTEVSIESEWLKRWAVEGEVNWGTDLNRDPAEGAPTLGQALGVETELTYRPSSRMRLSGEYLHRRLTTRSEDAHGGRAGRLIFGAHRFRVAVRYQFTRALSVRAILDGRLLRTNRALINLKSERSTGLDVLLAYQPEPYTAVYLGVTDRYDNLLALAPSDQDDAGRYGITRSLWPRSPVARQLFIKISHMIR